jgi:4'-phosphopantetheinyl transferase
VLKDAAWRLPTADRRDRSLDLWAVRLTDIADRDLDESILHPAERDRAARPTLADDRRAFVAVHVLLRQALAERLRCSPAELTFSRAPCPVCGGPDGRPILAAPTSPIHFSLARSADLALVGLADSPIGVDIQELPSDRALDPAVSLLHPAERDEILAARPAERALVFTRLWTRKEAYLKGLGTGIAHDLASDYLGTQQPAATPSDWEIIEAPVPAGYAGAVAVRSDARLLWQRPG